MADDLLEIVRQFDSSLILKYNKFYIGLSREGQPYNFITIRPRKSHVVLELKLPENDDIGTKIEQAGFETLGYNKRWGLYRLQVSKTDISQKNEVLRELLKLAYDRRAA